MALHIYFWWQLAKFQHPTVNGYLRRRTISQELSLGKHRNLTENSREQSRLHHDFSILDQLLLFVWKRKQCHHTICQIPCVCGEGCIHDQNGICRCGTTRGGRCSGAHIFDLSVLEAQERQCDRLGRFPGRKDTLMLLWSCCVGAEGLWRSHTRELGLVQEWWISSRGIINSQTAPAAGMSWNYGSPKERFTIFHLSSKKA